MMFDPTPLRISVVSIPCPECYQRCYWCGWHRMNACKIGCGGTKPDGKPLKCEKGEALKGTQCGTCDGSGKVTERRELIDV